MCVEGFVRKSTFCSCALDLSGDLVASAAGEAEPRQGGRRKLRSKSEWLCGVTGSVAVLLWGCGSPSSEARSPDPQRVSQTVEPAPEGETRGEGAKVAEEEGAFALTPAQGIGEVHGASPSKIKATVNEAALKFLVVDKKKGPVPHVAIVVVGPDKIRRYAAETDEVGYTEILVPIGARYDLAYLSLGRDEIAASVSVSDEPHQNIRLTLRYDNLIPDVPPPPFVLGEVTFETGKATLRSESYARLDRVVEFLEHKSVRLRISGHTDNVGARQKNKVLSEMRARACKDYIVSKGIDPARIDAVGFGDEQPVAPNDTESGRQKNRRIEALELPPN